jgi:hypothetical protein
MTSGCQMAPNINTTNDMNAMGNAGASSVASAPVGSFQREPHLHSSEKAKCIDKEDGRPKSNHIWSSC